jgi:hypothetical protein
MDVRDIAALGFLIAVGLGVLCLILKIPERR